MIFTTKLTHLVLVRSLLHDTICPFAVRVFGMVRFLDMHVDWADVVRVMVNRIGNGNRYGNGNRNLSGDIIDVPIFFLFLMTRCDWRLLVWLLNLMMVLVLLCLTRLFYLASTVDDRFVDGFLVCRSRCSIRHLTEAEILIRSVNMIRHSADISMLVHGDWSKIRHDIDGMMIMFDPVIYGVSLCYGRIIYGPSLLLELFLG